MKKLIIILTLSIPTLCFSQWNGIYFHADYENAIEVINQDTIIAVTNGGGRIHHSTNGGQSWSFYQTEFINSWFSDVHFPTNSVGYACGGTAFGEHTNVIVKTTDGGQTWDSLTANNFAGYSFLKIHFLDANTGFVAHEASDMLITTDGGNSFNTISTQGQVVEITSKPNSEIFISLSKYISANKYTFSIAKSTDLGSSWNVVYTDTMTGVTGVNDRAIRNIYFVDNNIGYATGGNGLFLKTNDGGSTWTSSFINPYSNLTGLHFTSSNVGYINNAGGIYKTEDGGASWTVQNISPLSIIYQIKFANDTIGYAVGDNGIYKTKNGGVVLSLDEFDKGSYFSIYPNPTSDKIFISSKEPIISITIFNQSGQKIKELSQTNEFDISLLSSGVYFLTIKSDKYHSTKKIVKK